MTKNHGGDRSNNAFAIKESTHQEKHDINIVEKTEIAQKEVALIEYGDTIFPRNRDDGGVAGHP